MIVFKLDRRGACGAVGELNGVVIYRFKCARAGYVGESVLSGRQRLKFCNDGYSFVK